MFYNTQGYYLKNNFVETFADTTSTTLPVTPLAIPPASTPKTDSCANVIKDSYADFKKQYELLKKDYEKQLDEQKDINQKNKDSILKETETWKQDFKKMKAEQEILINKEKEKLDDLKKIFEEKIKSLNSSINDISISIKKI
jgi:hypothetical protein